jgi:hypothetical protein
MHCVNSGISTLLSGRSVTKCLHVAQHMNFGLYCNRKSNCSQSMHVTSGACDTVRLITKKHESIMGCSCSLRTASSRQNTASGNLEERAVGRRGRGCDELPAHLHCKLLCITAQAVSCAKCHYLDFPLAFGLHTAGLA